MIRASRISRNGISLRYGGHRTCPIDIGRNLFDRIGADLGTVAPAGRYAVIADATVASLYADRLRQTIARHGHEVHVLAFPPGERSKSRETKAAIEDRLLELGFGRDSGLIALGGGVCGDLAGFIAATYMRGVPFIQVPTTLLAMADSSIGGKNGINLPAGKNLLGTFYQPRKVYLDTDVLASLPDGEIINGLAEIIKCALIKDHRFFAWLEKNIAGLRARDPLTLQSAVRGSIRIKASIVRNDERERDARKTLNYGHTIGHALETLTGGSLSHGHAVAIGMNAAARLSELRLGLGRAERERQNELLAAAGLTTRVPKTVSASRVAEEAKKDKKARGGELLFVLLKRIGAARIDCAIEPSEVVSVIESLR